MPGIKVYLSAFASILKQKDPFKGKESRIKFKLYYTH